MTTDGSRLAAACRACADACVRAAMNECWDRDVGHGLHYRLLSDCAQLCDLAAALFERESPARRALAAACADVCAAAAASCGALALDECAAACRACAEELAGAPAMPVYTLPALRAETVRAS